MSRGLRLKHFLVWLYYKTKTQVGIGNIEYVVLESESSSGNEEYRR